jgi:glycosyltransferase involved in cell wall biosynthesis
MESPLLGARALRVALVYETFGLRSSLERDRVLLAGALSQRGVDVHVYANIDASTADLPCVTLHDLGHPVPPHGRFRHPWHYARSAAKATGMLRRDRHQYDIVDVAGTTAWEHDVLRVHAVQAAEQRRWPSRGGRAYRLATARAFASPLLRPKIAVARAIERLQYRPGRFRAALAVTEEVARDLQEVHGVPPELVEVVPYPIANDRDPSSPPVRALLGLTLDDQVVLFVGHDYARKGLHDAIAAVAALDANVHLVIIGAGDSHPYLALAASHGARERVHFLGPTAGPEAALHEADLLLLPTREDVWGIVLVEAMAAGVPAITTAVAGASAPLRSADAGIVLDDPSVSNLTSALANLLANPQRREEMGTRGRAAASAFAIDRIAGQTLAAYERVCTKRR